MTSWEAFAKAAVPRTEIIEVADAIVRVDHTSFTQRPFRVNKDPLDDGAEVVNGVANHSAVRSCAIVARRPASRFH